MKTKTILLFKSKYSFFCVFNIILILFCQQNIFSQSVRQDSIRSYKLNEVVVTGTRIQIDKDKIPSSITVVNSKEISQSDETNILPVLSSQVPGLFINNRNVAGFGVGPNAAGLISIRGIGGNPNSDVLILIDGQPQFMGIFGHPIVDALNSSDIQRVEVIRGASSILYGSNAVGGAINIVSKEIPEGKINLNASSYYGTFKTINFIGSAGYKDKLFGIYSSLNNTNTDGSRTDALDGFNSTAGYLKLSLTPAGIFSFNADGNISKSKFYDPGTIYSPTVNNYYNYLRTRGSFSIAENINDLQGALRFFYSYGNHDFFDGWNSYDEMKGITFYQNLKYFEDNIFTIGIDYKNYGGKGTQPGLPPFAAKGLGVYHAADETAVYALLNYSPVKPLNIEAGLRFTKNSLFGNDVTPDFGAAYSVDESTIIKGSISKAFRSPTINDLYLFPVANPNLKPEHVWNYEISLDKRMLQNILDFELTVFYNKGDNLIVVVPPFTTKTNSGSFIHKGVEFAGKYFINNNFYLSMNYSFLNYEFPTLYAPKNEINIQLNYNYNPVQILANLQEVSGLYTSLQNSIQENYFTLNATVNYSLTAGIKIFLKGGNLFDKRYSIDEGYPMPGRTVFAGIKLNY